MQILLWKPISIAMLEDINDSNLAQLRLPSRAEFVLWASAVDEERRREKRQAVLGCCPRGPARSGHCMCVCNFNLLTTPNTTVHSRTLHSVEQSRKSLIEYFVYFHCSAFLHRPIHPICSNFLLHFSMGFSETLSVISRDFSSLKSQAWTITDIICLGK